MVTAGSPAMDTVQAKPVISKFEFPLAPPYQSRVPSGVKTPHTGKHRRPEAILWGMAHFSNNIHNLLF
jgi:hypothetical protein